MEGEDQDYSRDEVLAAERWAWAGEVTGERAEFFYDGIDFWRQGARGRTQAVRPGQTPRSGWWHQEGCNCPLCCERNGGGEECVEGESGVAVGGGEDADR